MADTDKLYNSVAAEKARATYVKNQLDLMSGVISDKADKATTLAGYGITDAYTKGETYNKTEVNGLVDTPHQNYVTVQATAQTTDATDVLPASGQAADTIYRVSNWDGSANSFAGAFDVTKYSEYAWDDQSNPNKYVFLCVKTAIGEVFDISVYNNNATYPDLASALGTNGANVPETLRKGGMSVKFVHSVDHKYVQYRLAASIWSTDIHDWTSEDPYFIDKIMQEVNEAIDEHTPIEITGDVTNAPDEEDLTSVNVGGTDVLKFKDRTYNPLTYSGMGRKILRKNIVEGVNTLTQDMFYKDGDNDTRVPNTNTIYVIQHDFTLGEDITVPANCVLEFEGGSISGKQTLNFNSCVLKGNVRIDVNVAGKILNKEFHLSWLYNKTIIDDKYYSLNEDIFSLLNEGCYIFDGLKYIISPVTLGSNITINLNDSEVKGKGNINNTPIFFIEESENVTIENGIIDGNKENISGNNAHGVNMVSCKNCNVRNIQFKNINRICLAFTDCTNISIEKISAEDCGGVNDSIGSLLYSYNSRNFTIRNVSFKNSHGVGGYIISGENYNINNLILSNIDLDNGFTIEDTKNICFGNISIDTVANVGLEINASDNICVNNANINNCAHNGLMVSVYRPTTYKACTNISLINVLVGNSGSDYYDIDIISAVTCSVINSKCSKILVTKNDTLGDGKFITLSNVEADTLNLYNEISAINCKFTSIIGYPSIINKFPIEKSTEYTIDLYFKGDIAAGESHEILLPNIANQIRAMSGTIDVLSVFTSSYSQNNKKLISFKIVDNIYTEEVVSSIDGSVARPVTISLTVPNLVIENNNNVDLTIVLRIRGEYMF